MLFNSQIFVFAFLPIVLFVYYGLHRLGAHTFAKAALILASFIFYGYNHVSYLLILILSIVFNYGIYILLEKLKGSGETGEGSEKGRNSLRRIVTVVAVTANIAVIFYFKYFNFFIDNSNRFLHTDWTTRTILLPLGISFFTFQQVSFVVDAYRGETDNYSFIDYALFVSFFPQLVAGPIVLHNQLISQFKDEKRYRLDINRFGEGIRYFVIGLFKKTMMADPFGRIVDLGYSFESAWDTPSAALIILGYTLQIYFDFSGYSDMAIGLGKMLGFELPKNFDMPYKATDISMFWKRWHMTMTGFFTKYVYFPLGGNRKGKIRTYINTMIVFAVSGLWHGAGWAFVEWGMLHGLALCFHRAFKKKISRLPKVFTGAVTFIFVNFAWVLFRAEGVYKAKMMLRYLFLGGIGDTLPKLCRAFAGDNLSNLLKYVGTTDSVVNMYAYIFTAVCVVVTLLVVWLAPSSHALAGRKELMSWEGPVYAFMALLSIMTFMNVSTFLYFNF